MKKGFTYIAVLLDKSGSMNSIREDTIGGFNSFIEDQKKIKGDALMTLVQFNTQYSPTFRDVPVLNVAPLSHLTYVPSDGTALLDSFGKLMTEVGQQLARMPEHERPEKVIFVVISDGLENSSREFSKKAIREQVEHQKAKYRWEFLFLGANMDAFTEGNSMGFSGSLGYVSSPKGIRGAMKGVSAYVGSSRLAARGIKSAGKIVASIEASKDVTDKSAEEAVRSFAALVDTQDDEEKP